MMHENSIIFNEPNFDNIIFSIDNNVLIHGGIFSVSNDGKPSHLENGKSHVRCVQLSLRIFLQDFINGARFWLDKIVTFDTEKSNRMNKLLQFRKEGFDPFIVGLPVIA